MPIANLLFSTRKRNIAYWYPIIVDIETIEGLFRHNTEFKFVNKSQAFDESLLSLNKVWGDLSLTQHVTTSDLENLSDLYYRLWRSSKSSGSSKLLRLLDNELVPDDMKQRYKLITKQNQDAASRLIESRIRKAQAKLDRIILTAEKTRS